MSSASRSRSGQKLRDARRQTLLDAARDLFSQSGYHATTVDDITRRAGVAKGTFYLYFREKREIYHEVIRGFLGLIKELGVNISARPDSPAEFFAQVRRAVMKLVTTFMDNRELARLAYRESMGLDARLGDMLQGFYQDVAELQARNVQTAIDLGILRPVDTTIAAYAHIGMVERVLMAFAEDPSSFPRIEDVVEQLVGMGFSSIRAPGGPEWPARLVDDPEGSSGR